MSDWFVIKNGKEHGPFKPPQLQRFVAAGKLKESDLVRRQDASTMQLAKEIEGLFRAAEAPPPLPESSPNASFFNSAEASTASFDWGPWRKFLPILSIAIMVFGGIRGCMQVSGGHGKLLTFNNGELYYNSSVDVEDARRLGNYLVQEQFFNGARKTVQLRKEDGTFEVRMVVKKGTEQDPDHIAVTKLFATQISTDVFGGSQVDIHLCDDHLRTLRVVVPLR